MYAIIVFYLLFVGISFYIAARMLIVSKKEIYYGWIEKRRKVSSFDYFTSTDGSWMIKSIDFKKLLADNPRDIELECKIKVVRVLTKVNIALVVLLVIGAVFLAIIKEGGFQKRIKYNWIIQTTKLSNEKIKHSIP
ncbi:MAG TPA: hypothetical protein VGE90_08450 [Chitinophaga sp.]